MLLMTILTGIQLALMADGADLCVFVPEGAALE